MRVRACLVPAVVLLSLCGSSLAQSTVTGRISDPSSTQFNPIDQFAVVFPGSIQRSINYNRSFPNPNFPSYSARATSSAGPGFVGAGAFAQLIQPVSDGNPGTYYLQSNATGVARWNDVVLSGAASGMQPFSMNFGVDGFFNTASSTITNPAGVSFTSFSTVSFSLQINGESVAQGVLTVNNIQGAGLTLAQNSGVFSTFGVFGGAFSGTSTSVMVPVNTPFTVEMVLQAETRVTVPLGGSGVFALNADFTNTATIATTGPAFNVPAGYTVNSAEANVANNAFTLVPGPGTVTGLVALSVFASRRRRES